MTHNQSILKSLVIYGSALPLAIFLGYLLSNPLHRTTLLAVAGVSMVLSLPIVLRFHHPLLFLSWNMTAVAPFVPGRPQLWLVMALVSFTICVVQYALVRRIRFVQNRSVLYPLLVVGGVVLGTALLTGGIGLNITGSENVGGKRYLYVFGAILGFMAMAAHHIPREKARLYLGLFLLGAISNSVGNLLPYLPSAFYPLFQMFPVEAQGVAAVVAQDSVAVKEAAVSRFAGGSVALIAVAFFLIARYGMRRLISLRRPAFWILVAAAVLSTLGGYRSNLIRVCLIAGLVFYLEGLHRSKLMPVIVVSGLLVLVGAVGFADRLPLSMQRSLSFLPIKLDPIAVENARVSSEWRLEMWSGLIQEVPGHLLLGKGLSIRAEELDMAETLRQQGRGKTSEVAMMAGDYHSGPLSVAIPFGLWGIIAWIWFVWAGVRATYLNYKNGDSELKNINTFLFAFLVAKVIMFHVVYGQFYADLPWFVGVLGFSISLNHGIRKPVPATETSHEALHGPLSRPRLMPGFSHLNHR